MRNLLGTGLVDFTGGLLTSGIALVLLVRISPLMTFIALGSLLCFAVALEKAFARFGPSSGSAARSPPKSRAA